MIQSIERGRRPCSKCGALGTIWVVVEHRETYVTVPCCEGCWLVSVLGREEFDRRVQHSYETTVAKPDAVWGEYIKPPAWWQFWR